MELQDYYYRAYVEMVDTIKGTKEYAEFKNALRSADKGEDTHTGTVSHREIDLDWVEAMEDTLIYIDRAIREQRRFIEQTEEVVPIEKAHRITVESVRHLAQHTNLIARVEDDTVTPEQILTIYREESFAIYENRFIRTLLDNAIRFVEIRYQALKSVSEVFFSQLEINREVKFRQEWMNYEFKFGSKYEERASFDIDADVSTLTNFERIVRIRRILMDFRSTPLMREVEKSDVVRPPIIRTNLMTKNVNYRKALDLWTFIETYNKDGYRFIAAEADGVMSKEMKDGLYNMFDMTSSVVRFNLNPVLKSRLQENYERENRRRREEAEEAERKRKQEEQARLEAAVDAEKAKWQAYVEELNKKHEAEIEELEAEHEAEIEELERKREKEVAYERAERERQVAYEKAEREKAVAFEREERAKEVAAVAAAAAAELAAEKQLHAEDVENTRIAGEKAVEQVRRAAADELSQVQRIAAEELEAERKLCSDTIAQEKQAAAEKVEAIKTDAENRVRAEAESSRKALAELREENKNAMSQLRYSHEIAIAAADEKHKTQILEQSEKYEKLLAAEKRESADAQERMQKQYGDQIRSLTEARDSIRSRAEAELASQRDVYEKRIADSGEEHRAELMRFEARNAKQIETINQRHGKELERLEKRLQAEVGRNDRDIKKAEQSFERRLGQRERQLDRQLAQQKRSYEGQLTNLRRDGARQIKQLEHKVAVLQRRLNRLPDIEEEPME